jgi:predicted esterase
MNPYSYQHNELDSNLHLKETTPRWLRYTVDFSSACNTLHKETNTIFGEYFQPRDASCAPLAIIVHGWGDRSVMPCRLIARTLAKKGIASFILYLVFHSRRMPETIRNRIPLFLTTEEWFEGYRASVIEIRQIIDWASSRPELDKEQIAVIGISLGGFVSAIAMGLDKRIKAGIFLVTGGNSEKITWNTKSKSILKGHGCTEAECHQTYSHYPQYLAEVAEKGFGNVIPVKECFLTDTLTFAPYLRERSILMLNALWDETIPKEATLDFWKACHKPSIMWLPGTHITFWLWYPLIERKITDFLTSIFGISNKRPT